MISIIISSANIKYLNNIRKNIDETIGIPYEIIATDNSGGERGICEIYNEGARKAKFDYLCYMHEDLNILTQNWGINVIEKFKNDPKLGIIGVVGSSYKPLAPSGWGASSLTDNVFFANYIQHYKNENKPSHLIKVNPSGKIKEEVVCVDGMWFCTKKSIVQDLPFDENLLKGFHCYDIDFCLNVGKKFSVAVVFDVLMEHFSEGSYNKSWLEDTIKIHEKWKEILPASVGEINKSEQISMEKRAYKMLFKRLKNMGYSYSFGKKIMDEIYNSGKLNFKLYGKLQFYLFKYYFILSKKH